MNPYENYQNYYHHPYYLCQSGYSGGYSGYYQTGMVPEVMQPGRRSFNFTNLVEVRKTHSRLGGSKYD